MVSCLLENYIINVLKNVYKLACIAYKYSIAGFIDQIDKLLVISGTTLRAIQPNRVIALKDNG